MWGGKKISKSFLFKNSLKKKMCITLLGNHMINMVNPVPKTCCHSNTLMKVSPPTYKLHFVWDKSLFLSLPVNISLLIMSNTESRQKTSTGALGALASYRGNNRHSWIRQLRGAPQIVNTAFPLSTTTVPTPTASHLAPSTAPLGVASTNLHFRAESVFEHIRSRLRLDLRGTEALAGTVVNKAEPPLCGLNVDATLKKIIMVNDILADLSDSDSEPENKEDIK